jgi:hypothetical protein
MAAATKALRVLGQELLANADDLVRRTLDTAAVVLHGPRPQICGSAVTP